MHEPELHHRVLEAVSPTVPQQSPTADPYVLSWPNYHIHPISIGFSFSFNVPQWCACRFLSFWKFMRLFLHLGISKKSMKSNKEILMECGSSCVVHWLHKPYLRSLINREILLQIGMSVYRIILSLGKVRDGFFSNIQKVLL